MEYREIVAVTGLGGLYQLVTSKSDGAIVRNIADKSTRFISARQHHVTPLESIEVYTTGDNVRLQEVFKKMQEHEQQVPPEDPKAADNKAIKQYFKTIFPDFDEDRVYVSDMKKMLKWYELLKANDLLQFEKPAEEGQEAGAATADTAQEETAEESEAIADVIASENILEVENEQEPHAAGGEEDKNEDSAAEETAAGE